MERMIAKLSVKAKLIIVFLVLGLVPSVLLELNSYRLGEAANTSVDKIAEAYASSISDKVSRNLFERYGDVQAFGLNGVISNRDHWYKQGASSSTIVKAMNDYVLAYGMYYLTLLVDLKGNVIGVNDLNKDGKAIDTAFIYQKNFASAKWFQDALAGNFYTSPGNLTGTVVQD